MWPRTVEIMLSMWLLSSPFIFHPSGREPLPFALTYLAALSTLTISSLCFFRKWERLHVGTLLVGVILAVVAYLQAGRDASPAYQNLIISGLLISMMGMIPTHCDVPPRKWELFFEKD